MEKILDFDNLALAAYKAFRGKRYKQEVINFVENFTENLQILRDAIVDGTVSIGVYHYFVIYDPKERVICAANLRERILHHAVMNVCHEYFDRRLIYDTYATRVGKGVYAALDRVKNGMRGYKYFVKLDVRKYYDTIEHAILKEMLRRMFKDDQLLELFDRIIDSYHASDGRGLPIGNLTSQYFANLYLSGLDRYMKETFRVPVYVRYMDDMVILTNDRDELKQIATGMNEYAAGVLHLQLKPPVFGKCTDGVTFLGYKILPGCLLLNGRSKRRFRSKLLKYAAMYEKGRLSEAGYAGRLLPLMAFTRHARAMAFRQSCIKL